MPRQTFCFTLTTSTNVRLACETH